MLTFREYYNQSPPEVRMDIPLLIRVFEYIMDDIKTDVLLHKFVEKLMAVKPGKTLTMADYDKITR